MRTINDLYEKWNSISPYTGGFLLVSDEHPLSFHIGYLSDSQKCFIVLNTGKLEKISSSKAINVENILLSDNSYALRFSLNYASLDEIFRESGVLIPALARPAENGYELISGHRRLAACRALGLSTMPVIVRNLTDEEAVIAMVDSNLQREHILPSEKAFAYKMKMEALSHQGKTSRQVGEKWSVSQISEAGNDSERQIHRYIRLTNLIPDILKLVDEGRIALTPAVELHDCGRCIIIDAHSFPAVPLPYEACSERPDFCLGTDSFHTPYPLLRTCYTFLRGCGLEVAVNRPFSCTIVPLEHLHSDTSVSSVMIEVNRRLYMTADGSKTDSFSDMLRPTCFSGIPALQRPMSVPPICPMQPFPAVWSGT